MSSQLNPQSEKNIYSSMVKEPENYDTENTEIMNTSGYSLDKNECDLSDTERTKDFNNIDNNDINKKSPKVLNYSNPRGSIKSQKSIVLPSKYMPKKSSINTSLQNNISEYSLNISEISPIEETSITNEKILPSSIVSHSNKRKSVSLDNKSEFDNSSIIVEINDKEEDIIDIEKNEDILKEKVNDSFVDVNNKLNETNDLKKKIQLNENRVSIATSGDFTYVDNNMEADNVKNLKRLTDTTSVPPIFSDIEKSSDKIQDKEEADIANKEHKIKIEEDDEDNTCAICLIETQKPTDIDNINNNDGSNETVIAPTKEDIDNYECKLHCMHKFHYSCIAQWLERSQNCPICRMEIKHYEIEAIEKRFDISINVKEEPLPLVQPHYNTTFEFETEISEELVREFMSNHLPWVKFKPYFYIKFFLYFILYFILTVAGIVISIISFTKEKMFFASYVIVLSIIVGFTILCVQLFMSIKKKKLTVFTILQPASSGVFYGIVAIIFILLFANLNNFIKISDKPITVEEIYQYVIAGFFAIMMIWSCVEARFCYLMFKEDNRRTVDAEVARRNQEIINRSRQEEAREREEFERNFSHLND